MSDRKVTWVGDAPKECDLCGRAIINVFVDGCLTSGSWACMCVACHAKHGTGLGTGCGQQYERMHTDKCAENILAYHMNGGKRGFNSDCTCTMQWVKVQG